MTQHCWGFHARSKTRLSFSRLGIRLEVKASACEYDLGKGADLNEEPRRRSWAKIGSSVTPTNSELGQTIFASIMIQRLALFWIVMQGRYNRV
jgi:hypothetical protein